MTDGQDDVTLTEGDIAELTEWNKDICSLGLPTNPDIDEDFNELLRRFGPTLGRFFHLKDEKDRPKLEHFFKVYAHKAAGDRANNSDWTARFAIFIALVTPATVFLVQLIATPVTRGTWHSPWLWATIIYALAAIAFYFGSTTIMGWAKRWKKWWNS